MKHLFLAIIAAAWATTAVSAESQWNPDSWNPVPAEGDVTMPLPCGGAIVFRAIATSLTSSEEPSEILADRAVVLGRNDTKNGVMDFARSEYLSAPFLNGAMRYFLLGKYEVSRRQYESVMRDECPSENTETDSLPGNGISWYDAVDFTRRLNRFWYGNAMENLPKAGSAPGFARLPNEAEWEFAARGGLQVSDAERQDLRFPFESGAELRDYAFYSDTQSADGVINDIGLLKPNPLGLHDILGNVAEITFDAFRMNRAGRLHGQRGGFVVKGGSYLSEADNVTNAGRTEFPFFNLRNGEEFRSEALGLRVVISAPVLSDLGGLNGLELAWGKIGNESLPQNSNPIQILRAIADREADLQLKKQLQSAAASLVAQEAQRQEVGERLMSTSLLSAGYLQKTFCTSKREVAALENLFSRNKKLAKDFPNDADYPKSLAKITQALENTRLDNQEISEVYADQIVRFQNDYPNEIIQAESKKVVDELKQRRRPILGLNIAAFVETIKLSRASNYVSIEDISKLVQYDLKSTCPN